MIMKGGRDMLIGESVSISVESSIPIPAAKPIRKYPHEVMDVGDSFYVEGIQMQVVLNANWRAGKRLGKAFIARKEGVGIRVWRTA